MIAVCRTCRALVAWPPGQSIHAPAPAGARLWHWRCPCGGALGAYRPGRRGAPDRSVYDYSRALRARAVQLELPGVAQLGLPAGR